MSEVRRTKRVKFNITDFDELAKYFAKLSEKGIHFEKPSRLTYSFIKAEPQSLDYFIEYNSKLRGDDKTEMIRIAEDAGWQLIYSTRGISYFCAKSGMATPFYTDNASLIARYNRIWKCAIGSSLLFLFCIYYYSDLVINAINIKDIGLIIINSLPLIIFFSFLIFSVKAFIQSILKIKRLKGNIINE